MRKIRVIVIFMFAWIMVACGPKSVPLNVTPTGGANESPTDTVPTTVSVTLDVTMTDDSFDSTTYTVPAGATVTVNVINQGAASHTFDILKKGEQLTSYQAADENKILWGVSLLAGETKSVTFTAPAEPGEYQIICRVPGHLLVGMGAKLIVK